MATEYPNSGQIADDLAFTEATLDDNMINQAGLFAHYARLTGEAQYEMEKAKMELEIRESKAALSIRDRAENNGERVTEKFIENQVLRDPEVVKARVKYLRARRNHEGMRGATEGLRHKRDMMVQIGVARRTEQEISARVMEKRAAADNAKSMAAEYVERKKSA